MNTNYVIKGWENLNNEFDKLDNDPNVDMCNDNTFLKKQCSSH